MLIVHDREQNILICTGCRSGISPGASAIARHLLTYHRVLPADDRGVITSHWEVIKALNPDDAIRMDKGRPEQVVSAMQEYRYRCLVAGCDGVFDEVVSQRNFAVETTQSNQHWILLLDNHGSHLTAEFNGNT